MKRTSLQLVVLSVALVCSGFTVAETGKGYMLGVSSDSITTADGTRIAESTSKGVWLIENHPEGFSSVLYGECSGTFVTGEDSSNKGSAWRCRAIDVDGDGYVSVGTALAPDWSDCAVESVVGWGKYAGTSYKGNCQPAGPFAAATVGNTNLFMWTGEWTLPE
jgi:hypothetical protein